MTNEEITKRFKFDFEIGLFSDPFWHCNINHCQFVGTKLEILKVKLLLIKLGFTETKSKIPDDLYHEKISIMVDKLKKTFYLYHSCLNMYITCPRLPVPDYIKESIQIK